MNNNGINHPLLVGIFMAIVHVFFLAQTSFSQAEEVFALQLRTQPFNSTMCKKIRPDENLRIQIAHHRDLVLRKVPNQFVPKEFEDARKKPYVHSVSIQDLTNGVIPQGSIAFDSNHAVIFTESDPNGVSREDFLARLPKSKISLANRALNTFLRLHPILNAAIDGCRPYPSQVTYGTDDEIDKIEAGRLAYRNLAKHFNASQYTGKNYMALERGISDGFYDPRTEGKRVSYRASNPLNFYRATSNGQ